eukprot:g15118.t1
MMRYEFQVFIGRLLERAQDNQDQTKEVKRSNVDERQFLTNDADGKTVFDRAKNASRNRLQRSLVAASEYQNNKENQSDLSSAKPRMDDRDLEDIEQEVEEQIQIATANGEFDNVEGKGKPLKSLLGGDNPYLDSLVPYSC